MAIRFFDMFSGIGGFRSGLEAVGGFECIGHCEIDPYPNTAYNAIFETRGEYYCDDARKINPDNIPDFDLVCAGFPCQRVFLKKLRDNLLLFSSQFVHHIFVIKIPNGFGNGAIGEF